jgi:hypothetical protein
MAYYRRNYGRYNNQPPKPKFTDPSQCGVTTVTPAQIAGYSGSDTFMITIRDAFTKYGHLSQRQWEIAAKTLNKTPYVPKPAIDVKAPLPIFINRTVAFREIRDKYKLKYGIFALKIIKIISAGKARNGNHWAEFEVVPDTDSAMNCCRVCGKTLKDHNSIISGIGPDCAKRFGGYNNYKSNIQQFMLDFKKEVASVGIMTIKVWENQIKDNLPNFKLAVEMYTNQPQNAVASTATIVAHPNPTSTAVLPTFPGIRENASVFVHKLKPNDLKKGIPVPGYEFSFDINLSQLATSIGHGNYLSVHTINWCIEIINAETNVGVLFKELDESSERRLLIGYTNDGLHKMLLRVWLNK